MRKSAAWQSGDALPGEPAEKKKHLRRKVECHRNKRSAAGKVERNQTKWRSAVTASARSFALALQHGPDNGNYLGRGDWTGRASMIEQEQAIWKMEDGNWSASSQRIPGFCRSETGLPCCLPSSMCGSCPVLPVLSPRPTLHRRFQVREHPPPRCPVFYKPILVATHNSRASVSCM